MHSIFCLAAILVCEIGRAQPTPVGPNPEPIRAAVQAALDAKRIGGAVVSVMHEGRPVLVEAFGSADGTRPLAPDALFRIASMTKPITSVAVMVLVEDGLLRLDDPVERYLPDFAQVKVYTPGGLVSPARAVTIRDLLNHTSGVAYGLNPPEPLREQFATANLADGLNANDPTLEENIAKVAKLPLAHQPGTAWTYGMNTDVLGRVIEVVSGQRFDSFLTERVFKPLRMTDTSFQVPAGKVGRLAAVFTPTAEGVQPVTEPTLTSGITVAPPRPTQPMKYQSGGAGLVSTAADYTRFTQMLLNEGELDGVRVLKAESVRQMTQNQIGQVNSGYPIHGDKFGLGFGVQTLPGGALSVGSYSWGGFYHTLFWVDPSRKLTAVVMTQLWPWGESTLWDDFPKAVYAALPAVEAPPAPAPLAARPDLPSRFLRVFPFQMGEEHGNPKTNGKFRVNDASASLHPSFRDRSEVRGNGMMQIQLTEPIANILAADLQLELWGGHPHTANKRVTVNGRTTYTIPEIGTAAGHCTHQYPVIPLERSDLVTAHNVFQFACDRGSSFWGHFIVENANLRVELKPDHATLQAVQLSAFTATVTATPAGDDIQLALNLPEEFRDRIEAVHFHGYYDGFDENGNGQTRDWHGMTKQRQPVGHLGTATEAPFAVTWNTSELIAQTDMAVRATVQFKDHPDLIYETASTTGLATAARTHDVLRFRAAKLPTPFWSRDNKQRQCEIAVSVDPAVVQSAELRVAIWDGGTEQVRFPVTLNGRPLAFESDKKHDVKVLRLPIEPASLIRGVNTFAVLSDTTHHGIEILTPGPELWIRTRPGTRAGKPTPPDDQRRAAMNEPGHSANGQRLFASAALKCATCHTVNGQGGLAGPDLSQVAGKLDRTHLIESVLEPSAQILEGYRTTIVTLADGRTLTGIVTGETAEEFVLVDAEGTKHKLAVNDVENRTTSSESLMPAGLCQELTPAEFTDLMAYLDTLRTGRKLNPGEGISGAVQLPAGFTVEPVVNGLTGATAFTPTPDGRFLVCEQTGALRVVKEGRLLPEPFVKLDVACTWERGLIGVTIDPEFPAKPYVYVCYVAAKPYPHHVISRFTAAGDVAAPDSEVVLFEGDDQTQLGGHKPDGHQGGAIHFGTDGKLYVGLGEQTAEKPAQTVNSLLGKVLRLNADGSIPSDNPFVTTATGKYRAVWALGFRNPFVLAVQPETGRIFINDVGGKAEEINEGFAGANYGWPTADHGPTSDSRFRGPIHHYPTACITGGAFCPVNSPWPAEFHGRYFFTDFNHGFLKTLDPAQPAAAAAFAAGFRRPTDLRFAADGSLYVLVRDAWVIDNRFEPDTGSLLRVSSTTEGTR